MQIIQMSKADFVECYWHLNGTRAAVIVEEPTFDIFPHKSTAMCEQCFRFRKQVFPFEILKYEVIKYND